MNIEGQEYVSSRKAAEIAKYSNDYIGQLCRTKKISARMIGRTWFVEKSALLRHKEVAEEALSLNGKKHVTREYLAEYKHEAVAQPTVTHVKSDVRYFADERPLLPELTKKAPQKKTSRIRKNDLTMSPHMSTFFICMFLVSVSVSVYAFLKPEIFLAVISEIRGDIVRVIDIVVISVKSILASVSSLTR